MTHEVEPYEVEFEPTSIWMRNWGTYCGYVGVPRSHPWYGLGYSDLVDVDVHGGLTYAAPTDVRNADEGPYPHGTNEDVWWLGFDCAHAGDYVPGLAVEGLRPFPNETFKDLDYARAEVRSLVSQAVTAYQAVNA